MTTFLNIVLLILTSTATLAAFGGNTWKEGSEPILERITSRGWISLVCLFLGLCLGVLKEVRTTQRAEAEQRDAEGKQAALNQQLQATTQQLKSADHQLQGLREIARLTQEVTKLTQARLNDAQSTLRSLRSNLTETHDDLSQQSSVNLVTVLANTDQRIADLEVVVPFTSKASPSNTFHAVLLSNSSLMSCPNDVFATLSIFNGSASSSGIDYPPNDEKDTHEYFNDEIPMADRLIHPDVDQYGWSEDEDKVWPELVGQRSYNHRALIAEVHLSKKGESAGEFLNDLLQSRKRAPFFLSLGNDPEDLPASCVDAVRKYFSVAFERAYFGIVLKQKQTFRIYFKLRALRPTIDQGILRQDFAIDSKPLVSTWTGPTEFLDVKWPAK